MNALTETALIEAARGGDRGALEVLLRRNEARIYRFGLRMCRDPEDAKDVLQDTLLAAARTMREFRGASSISTWLYSIARSFCLKKRRHSKFAPDVERSADDPSLATDQLPDTAPDPHETFAEKQIGDALERAIQGLDPKYREVLVLRDVEGLTAPDVAQVLGVSVDAVKSRLHRARSSLRSALAPFVEEPRATGDLAPSCPDVATLFSQQLEGEISADVCAQMERHVTSCPRCRNTCDSLKRTLTLCRTTTDAEVPLSVQDAVRSAVRQLLAK